MSKTVQVIFVLMAAAMFVISSIMMLVVYPNVPQMVLLCYIGLLLYNILSKNLDILRFSFITDAAEEEEEGYACKILPK